MKESLIRSLKVVLDPFIDDFIDSIESNIHSITLPNWTCNDIEYTTFDFSRFTVIESIVIGDNSFGSVQTFIIDGLNRLKKLIIGINSFTKSLESIEIGQYSFSDYAGDFELKNLPQLQTIEIGTIGGYSCNFYRSSFVIRGIDIYD